MDDTHPREMIQDILSAQSVGPDRGGIDLSAWEHGFVMDMDDASAASAWHPSEKQAAALRQIWDRI